MITVATLGYASKPLLAAAGALDLGRMQRVELPAAMALFLPARLRGPRERDAKASASASSSWARRPRLHKTFRHSTFKLS